MNKMNSNSIDRQGVFIVGQSFEKIGYAFREQTVVDYGIDAIVEKRCEEALTGRLIALQIKTGESYFKEKTKDGIVYRGNRKHYNYWISYALPVLLVLCDESTHTCYWQVINEDTAELTDRGWKVVVPFYQTINNHYAIDLIAEKQNEFQARWMTLVFAADWMIEIRKKDHIILEIQEWVNRGSGRGDFVLKSYDDNQQEIVLYESTMLGFGCTEYSEVIRRMFPWAYIEVDKKYYDQNYDYDMDIENIKDNIYPYKNGAGEVDFYRLKMSLNDVGKAFFNIREYLENGDYYYIKWKK